MSTDDNNIDMREYLAPGVETDEQVAVTGKASKNKSNNKKTTPYSKSTDNELVELKKKAKGLCSCYEQWKAVSRYKKERLVDFIESKEFDSMKNLRENVFSCIHKGAATLIDLMINGRGFVRDHIENDLTLREAFEQEGQCFVKYLSNRSKIAFLLSSDTIQGKLQQSKEEKKNPPPTIIVIDNHDLDNKETTNDASKISEADGEILPVPGSEQEDMQVTSNDQAGLSSDNQGQTTCDRAVRSQGVGQDEFDDQITEERYGI